METTRAVEMTMSSGASALPPSSTTSFAATAPSVRSPANSSTSRPTDRSTCAGCGAELFRSDTKFESGTGWPSFYEPAVAGTSSRAKTQPRDGEDRGLCRGCGGTSVTCSTTDRTPTGLRYCMNSRALGFDPQ